MPEQAETGRAAPNKGGTRPRFGSSRSIPRNDRSPVGTPSTHWWRYASRDRTHRSARDWQRYVVGKVLLSPQAAKDPRAGAGGVATITVAGARAGELATGSTIEPGGRLKGLGTHPSPSATRNESGPSTMPGQWRLCTGVCTIDWDRNVPSTIRNPQAFIRARRGRQHGLRPAIRACHLRPLWVRWIQNVDPIWNGRLTDNYKKLFDAKCTLYLNQTAVMPLF